jgi:hypothetical protein
VDNKSNLFAAPARPAMVAPADAETAQLVKRINARERHSDEEMVKHARDQGQDLRELKSRLGHGNWEAWATKNLRMSLRQANRYVRFAKSAVTADLESQMAEWRSINDNVPEDTNEPSPKIQRELDGVGGAPAKSAVTADLKPAKTAVTAVLELQIARQDSPRASEAAPNHQPGASVSQQQMHTITSNDTTYEQNVANIGKGHPTSTSTDNVISGPSDQSTAYHTQLNVVNGCVPAELEPPSEEKINGEDLPADEEAREFDLRARAEEEKQKRIDKAKAEDAKHQKPPIYDSLGQEVPTCLRDLFGSPGVPDLINTLRARADDVLERRRTDIGELNRLVKHAIALRAAGYPYLRVDDFGGHARESLKLASEVAKELRGAAQALADGLPYAICPECKGDENGCDHCRKSGCVPRWHYEDFIRDAKLLGNDATDNTEDSYVEYDNDHGGSGDE